MTWQCGSDKQQRQVKSKEKNKTQAKSVLKKITTQHEHTGVCYYPATSEQSAISYHSARIALRISSQSIVFMAAAPLLFDGAPTATPLSPASVVVAAEEAPIAAQIRNTQSASGVSSGSAAAPPPFPCAPEDTEGSNRTAGCSAARREAIEKRTCRATYRASATECGTVKSPPVSRSHKSPNPKAPNSSACCGFRGDAGSNNCGGTAVASPPASAAPADDPAFSFSSAAAARLMPAHTGSSGAAMAAAHTSACGAVSSM